jgi:hypothetical protein
MNESVGALNHGYHCSGMAHAGAQGTSLISLVLASMLLKPHTVDFEDHRSCILPLFAGSAREEITYQ